MKSKRLFESFLNLKQAWKRIEETKKKAEEIIKTRQRNEEMMRKKEERERQKEEEVKKKQENNVTIKQQVKSRLEISKSKKQGLNQAKANAIRIEQTVLILLRLLAILQDNQEALEQQKQNNILKKYDKKRQIKEKEREALEKRTRENVFICDITKNAAKIMTNTIQEERKEKAKIAIEEKILSEQKERLEKEAHLSKMEQEEEELIQKLKNTQVLQQAALEDLEQALSSSQTSSKLFGSGSKIASGKKTYKKN